MLTLHGYCRTEGEDKLKEFVREREKRKTVLIKAADKTPVKTHEQNKRSSLVSTLLHVVRPGHESGGCWDWGPAKEVGFSLGEEASLSHYLEVP